MDSGIYYDRYILRSNTVTAQTTDYNLRRTKI